MAKHHIRSIDPLLGFAYSLEDLPLTDNKKIPGFVIYEDEPEQENEGMVLVTLGGSTTTPFFENNWPKALKTLLSKEGIKAKIYNGGVNGYSTNQDLLKFVRDVLPINPDVVISLNGINDLGFVHSIRKHPMIHPYANFVLKNVLKKPLKSKQKGDYINNVNLGLPVKTTPEHQWERNLRIMNSVAEEFSIKYFSFLQPTLGVGSYDMSADEKRMLEEYDQERSYQYTKEMQSFYSSALEIEEKYDFIINFVDIFRDSYNVYHDPRHPNADGYWIIAEAMLNHLKKCEII